MLQFLHSRHHDHPGLIADVHVYFENKLGKTKSGSDESPSGDVTILADAFSNSLAPQPLVNLLTSPSKPRPAPPVTPTAGDDVTVRVSLITVSVAAGRNTDQTQSYVWLL